LAKIIFMGTSDFACMTLAALEGANLLPELIITRPDSIAGRKGKLSMPPVKEWALAKGLPVWQPKNINSQDSVEKLKNLAPDLLVVVAYGQILGKRILSIPSLGAINVHASLLPDLRGAAPVEWAIMLGYTETGVTTMFMDEGLDTGDIILQQAVPIAPEENSGQLRERLAVIAQQLLPETIDLVLQGRAPRRPQPDTCRHYAPIIDKTVERLDWSLPAVNLANKVRGLAPVPGSYCEFRGRRLKIYKAVAVPGSAPQGEIVLEGRRLLAGTGEGLLEILEVQPAGKKISSVADFINGYRIQQGEVLL
jgi:methionyl-tRNA formyltransferase